MGLFGKGRLGSAIAREAGSDIVWSLGRDDAPGDRVDVAIDASHPDQLGNHLAWALETTTPLVIGTTGWTMPDLRERVSDKIGVLIAPNFSLTVALMARLATIIGRYANLEDRRDLYLLEHHHSKKQDAPSGTARMLADTLIKACPRKSEWKLGGPVSSNQLSVAVLRAGNTYSSHTIGLDEPAEVLEIRHEARSAAVFASGALAAAAWIQNKKGIYYFADMAAPMLDSLFSQETR